MVRAACRGAFPNFGLATICKIRTFNRCGFSLLNAEREQSLSESPSVPRSTPGDPCMLRNRHFRTAGHSWFRLNL
jgi:hypothetical protein